MPGSPSSLCWPAGVAEAMEAGSPGHLLEALATVPRGASEASPPRQSWADLDGDGLPPPGEFFAGSPGLLRAFLDRGPAEHVAFSDSEGYSDPEPTPSPAPPSSTLRFALPPPDAKGKATAEPSCRRRHRRRRHCRGQRLPVPAPQAGPSRPRLQSTVSKVERPPLGSPARR